MGLFDAVAMGEAASGHEVDALKGTLSVTIGDVLQAMILGGRQTHIFGPNLQFVADPNEIMGALLHNFPFISALALGMEGNSNFVFGHNTSATYGGPQYTIQRCHHTKFIYKAGIAGLEGVGDACPTDATYATLVKVTAALALLTALALDLTIHLAYPSFGGPTQHGPEQIPDVLKNISWDVVSRVLALLVWIEGHYLEVRKEWFVAKEAARLAEMLEDAKDHLSQWEELTAESLAAAIGDLEAINARTLEQLTETYEADIAAALK